MPRGDRLDPSDVDLILRLYRRGTPVKDIAAEVQVGRSTVDVLVRQARAEGRLDGVPVRPRGFGTMTPEQRRAIASKGGKAAHEQGKAHKFTSETGKVAGRKGWESLNPLRPFASLPPVKNNPDLGPKELDEEKWNPANYDEARL